MKLRRPRSLVERPVKAGDMLRSVEAGDDFNPAEWAEFEQTFRAYAQDALDDPMSETPYGSALSVAESYYVLHPSQRERVARFLPKAEILRDVLYSLVKGYPMIPAEFKIFYPDDEVYQSTQDYWPQVNAWLQKLRAGKSPDFYLESVVAAIRLFPERREELQETPDYWLEKFKGMQKYPDGYVKSCAKIVLLFPSVQAHVQEFMRGISQAELARKIFTTPDFGMRAVFKIIAGDATLQPDGTFGFRQQTHSKGPELPARPEV